MTPDIPELDLDATDVVETGRGEEAPRWREPAVPWWGVVPVAVAVAVVAAGLTHGWDERQDRRARQAVVALSVVIPEDAGTNGGGGGEEFGYNSSVQVLNTGPLPIELGALSTTSPGIVLHGNARNTVVPAGGAQRVDVDFGIHCPGWVHGQPVDIRVAVRTADGVQRAVNRKVVLRGTEWDDALTTC